MDLQDLLSFFTEFIEKHIDRNSYIDYFGREDLFLLVSPKVYDKE